MTPEKRMWQALHRVLHGWGHFTRHEDSALNGLPDVSFGARGVQGWIELKALKSWPKRLKTKVSIKHFTSDQRSWLWKRGQFGGRTWVLLRIEQGYRNHADEWLLFDHKQVWRIGDLCRRDLTNLATKVWLGVPDARELLDLITD